MKTFIKICGASRTGSTMLDLMLGNADDAFSCGEINAWFRPQRRHHFQLECRCGQKPCLVWEKIAYVPERQFHSTVLSKLGVHFVIDSSKDLCWVLDSQKWAVDSGIRVFNIVIWKNPIDHIYSFWKRGRSFKAWHKEFMGYYGRFLDTGLPFRAVSVDDLVSSPKHKLKEICDAVGISYTEEQEEFWRKQHHYVFGSYGVFKQMKAKRSTIRMNDAFPPEYEEQIDSIREKIAQDRMLQRIIKNLKAMEISYSEDFSLQEQTYIPRKPYPFWYYGKRMKQRLKRYFPDKAIVNE